MRLSWRVLRPAAVVLIATGAGGGLIFPSVAGAIAQASNVSEAIVQPGDSNITQMHRCSSTDGYYAFPSANSATDNGLMSTVGNAQGMLRVSFNLPSTIATGDVTITAPNPPRPSTVPGGAPWGTKFPTNAYDVHPGAAALYGCTPPSGQTFGTYYYGVFVGNSGSYEYSLPGGVTVSPAGNQVTVHFDFSGAGFHGTNAFNIYIANIVNPPEGTYNGVGYTVSVAGATDVPAPGQNSLTYTASTPDASTSTFTSSLSAESPNLVATNVPSNGAVLTATIYDQYYNPIKGESIYIGASQGDCGAETQPVSVGSGNGEPTTGDDGTAKYYAYGTEATLPAVFGCNSPDTFFAQDTSQSNFFLPTLISIPIIAADPDPASNGGSSVVSAYGGAYVSAQETQVTADGTSAATVSITLIDQWGNPAVNQAVVLLPTQPVPPAPKENLKHVIITPGEPPTGSTSCGQGPSSAVAGVSCTDGSGTTTFTITDTKAQQVSFEINDLTDGYTMPYTYAVDAPNIPIVDFLTGPTSSAKSSVSIDNGSSATLLADGTHHGTVTVSLLDAEGNPEMNKVVTLAGNAGSHSSITAIAPPSAEQTLLATNGCAVPAAGTTDCLGNAYFAVSDTTVETVTYTATDVTDAITLSSPSQEPVVHFITGSVSASNSTVDVVPTVIVGDGQGVATVTVTVLDGCTPSCGHALDGETVTIDSSAYSALTVVPPSAVTDANGHATFKIRSSQPIGNVSLPVRVGSVVLDATVDLDIVNQPDLANSNVSSTPLNPEATGATDAQVTVHVADSANAPIVGLSLQLIGGSIVGSSTATTDASGNATFDVGATLPGAVTFTVVDASDNLRTLGTTIVNFVPVPDEAHESTVTALPVAVYNYISGQPDNLQTSTVTVTLKDASGNPIAGDTAILLASTPDAVVATSNDVSDANGHVTFSVTDPVAEHVTFYAVDVTSSTLLVQSADVNFVLRPNEDTTSSITASPTLVEANGTSTSTITVTLRNNGALLAGNTVSLSQGQGHSIITTNDPVSNASGQVRFTVTNLTAQSVAYQATDLTTGTELTHDAVVTFTAPPGGSVQPVVTSISPSSGPGAGGTQVTILGANFSNATGVQFGTKWSPTFTIDPTGTEIIATSPIPVAAGAVNVQVDGPGGVSDPVASDVFTYSSAPPLVVASISPSSGPLGGSTTVVVTGTGLTNALQVRFGSLAAHFVIAPGGTSLTATAPEVSSPGTVHVTVATNSSSSHASSMDLFAFVGAAPRVVVPSISSLSPPTGPRTGGTLVIVHGLNFAHVVRVSFGPYAATKWTLNASGTILSVHAPPATKLGTVRVSVVTNNGTTAAVTADRFTYVAVTKKPRVTRATSTQMSVSGR